MKKYRCWSQFFSNDQGNQSLQNVGTIAIAATVLMGLLQAGRTFEDRGRERLEELLAGRNNSEAAATIEPAWENSGVISTIETSTESSAKADLNSGALRTSDISDEVLMASFNFSEATSSSDSGNSTSKTTLKSGITSISGSIATGLPLSPNEDVVTKDTLEENESADEVTEVTETTVTQTTRESITEPENLKNAGILIRPQATMAAKSPSVKPPGNTNASQGASASASPLSSFSGSGSAGAGTSPSGVSGTGGGSLGAAGIGGSGSPLGSSSGGQGSFGSQGFSPDSSNAGSGKPSTNPDSDSDVSSQSTTTGSNAAASIAETAGRLRDAILGGNRKAKNDTEQDSGRLLESRAADTGSMNESRPSGSINDYENVSAEMEEQGGETDQANEDPDDIQDALPQQIRILGLDRTEPEKPRLRIALGESFEQIQIHADEQKLAFRAPSAGSISTIPLTPALTEPGSEILLIGISEGVRIGVYYEFPVAPAPSTETDISGSLATDSSMFEGEEF